MNKLRANSIAIPKGVKNPRIVGPSPGRGEDPLYKSSFFRQKTNPKANALEELRDWFDENKENEDYLNSEANLKEHSLLVE
jgi:hypothetical protein